MEMEGRRISKIRVEPRVDSAADPGTAS